MKISIGREMKLKAAIVFVITCLRIIDSSLAQDTTLCILRSELGDVIYNATNGTLCPGGNTTDYQKCPEENPTFISRDHCCIQDQTLLEECDLQLNFTSQSSIPVVYIDEELKIAGRNSSEEAMIYDRNSPMNTVKCNMVINVTRISESEQLLTESDFELENSIIQVFTMYQNYSGVYKLELDCNVTNPSDTEKRCLLFKLIDSEDNAVPSISDIGLSASFIEECPRPTEQPTTRIEPTTPSSTARSTTVAPSTLSEWEMYNKLLVYVVTGGGCALGLFIVFIILLCVLTGCMATRRRNRVRRKHQLETAPRQRRASNSGRGDHVKYRQNDSYAISAPNSSEEHVDTPEGVSLVPYNLESQPTPQLVKADIPVVPQLQQIESIDQVTFDTFKRPPKGIKATPEPKEPSTPVPNTQTETTPVVYYETVTPLRQPGIEKDPTEEEYDTLVHSGAPQSQPERRHFTLPVSNSQYSQLSTNVSIPKTNKSPLAKSEKFDPDRSYSLVTPRSQRKASSPIPLPPPIGPHDAIQLLGMQNKFSKNDIFSSSWSAPHMIDKFKQGEREEIQELYDHPASLDLVPLEEIRQNQWTVSNGFKEDPIYDVPPSRRSQDDITSLDSYVDMKSHSIHNM